MNIKRRLLIRKYKLEGREYHGWRKEYFIRVMGIPESDIKYYEYMYTTSCCRVVLWNHRKFTVTEELLHQYKNRATL